MRLLKGWGDTFVNIHSPEAQLYIQTVKRAKTPAEAVDLDQRIFEVADMCCHGTAVAGLALETNPFARLIVARFRFDFDLGGSKSPSIEGAKNAALAFARMVNYFKANQVRVVNMSWGFGLSRIEGDLQKYQVKAMDGKARRELAESIFSVYEEGMRKAFASAPEIVFVAAAGNSGGDTTFAAGLPQSLHLSNFLVVGALDRSGSPTFMTSYGDTVKVYAQGQDVPALLPGGNTAVLMGTSLAAPKVVNLIGKLLAVRPTLTSDQVIDLVVRGSVESVDRQVHTIDPQKTCKLLTTISK
ncbi:MAG: S8 family serine peptidase [Acidobacteriaceae bacterium]|nr:S8 family serine peptidase [Acidobacteriaceae bacterium]